MPAYPTTGQEPWGATLKAYTAPRSLPQANAAGEVGPFTSAKTFTTSGTTMAVGYDQTDNLLILAGQTDVFSSSDNGATISAGKGIPLSGQTNPGNQIGKIVRFGSLWVCLIKDQVSLCAAIYTSPAPGSVGSCTWTLRQNLTGGSDGRFSPCLATDGTQVLVGEYGDPLVTGTPTSHVWRSTNGTSWSTTFTGTGSGHRHIHAVYPDSYVASQWWMTLGDGPSPCLYKSTNGGASWTGVTAIDSSRQSVQISDDADYLYLAADATVVGTPCDMWVLDKATLATVRAGHSRDHRSLPVSKPGQYTTGRSTASSTTFNDFTAAPFGQHMKGAKITLSPTIPDGTTIASVTNSQQVVLSAAAAAGAVTDVTYQIHGVSEQWWSDPFFGCVDPATGVYYFTTPGDSTGLPNVRRGLFYIPYLGGPVEFLDYVNCSPRAVFVANGYLFCGNLRRPLLVPA